MLEAEHLAGPAEIADALGVHPNTINQWKVRHADFPPPVRVLRLGSIWDLREVVEWAECTGRLPRDAHEQRTTHGTAERQTISGVNGSSEPSE